MDCRRFGGKNAIVTGGGRDIGKAIVLRLGAEGANVAVNYNSSADAAEKVVSELRAMGVKAFGVQADVSTVDGVEKLVKESLAGFGSGIDVLVHNAGGLIDRVKVMDMPDSLWDAVMQLNLKSAFLLAKSVKPNMSPGGAIVHVGSAAARSGGGLGAAAYGASKGGLLTFTRGLAKELARENIRVNVVEPGLIDTRFHEKTDPEVLASLAKGIPLGRMGTSDEVASVVVFLASDDASYITGEAVQINGGLAFV